MNMFIAISRCLLPGSGAKAMRWETAPPHQPPHRVLLYLHLAALSDHDGGGAHRILEELHRGVLPMLHQALQQQRAAGEPQAVQEVC